MFNNWDESSIGNDIRRVFLNELWPNPSTFDLNSPTVVQISPLQLI